MAKEKEIKGNGSTIIGVAVTNRPNVRLRDHPIEFVEEDGQEMARVPFLVQGKYRYSRTGETLDFDDKKYSEFLKNHEAGVFDGMVGLDLVHKPELGALVWFEKSRGGRIVEEVVGKDKLLVGYGPLVSESAKDTILRFSAASVSYIPDYESNKLLSTVSGETNSYILEIGENGQSLFTIDEEVPMSDNTISLDEHNVKLEAVNTELGQAYATVTDLQTQVSDLTAKVQELEDKKEEPKAEPTPAEIEMGERIKALEAQNVSLAQDRRVANVRSVMLDLKQEKEGMAHPAVFLETIEKILLEKDVSDKIIALSDEGRDDADAVRSWFTRAILELATTTPRSIRAEGQTIASEQRMSANGSSGIMSDTGVSMGDDALDASAKELWEAV